MRVVYAGTPSVAVPSLRALHADPAVDVVAVVTRPDAPQGRKRILTPSPVAQVASELGIETIAAARLDDDATARIAALEPDLGVIVAYGGLVREPLLSVPAHGWINLHFSLLPRWRGAAPVQRALMAGDTVTGAAVFQLVPALDAGDVFSELTYAPGADETAGEVLEHLAVTGADLLCGTVRDIASGTASAAPQTGEPTIAHKLSIDDGLLDFSLDADSVLARYRGVTPEPGAHTTIDGARFKIHSATRAEGVEPLSPGHLREHADGVLVGTSTDAIVLQQVQPAGKARMAADDWFRGQREGVVLGS
ncbi:methionyl-tRNA formyltransferase [Microbacterium amylolyticum]|uniref:methionyl-tRNA formyltransferase n=1 Tax=Microbacterium amylolyticum TaxID=936337 RepID=UPI0013EE2256|nr:methionyl-tRNA formyltransferase [Microbacterium amylolyticum]